LRNSLEYFRTTCAVILTAGTGPGFPWYNPLLAGPSCPYYGYPESSPDKTDLVKPGQIHEER
jgi:hypothetical protein